MTTITRDELQELINDSAIVLLEALPVNYYDSAHLPGAKNLPLEQIDSLARRLMPDTATAVVTYCAGPACPNSKVAAERLEALGYTNVRAYEGGKEDWTDAGLPLESSQTEVA